VKPFPAGSFLAGKKVWVPRMSYGSARAFAAAFRSIGVDAECTPPSDERTRELGGAYTGGDECYPTKVTLGDFLKLLEQPGVDPKDLVLFLPTSEGPCRFGQYAPHLKNVLASIGYPDVTVLSPSSDNSYGDLGELAGTFVRTGWRALVAADILLKLLLKTRPYELETGSADALYEDCLDDLCAGLEIRYPNARRQMRRLGASLERARARFRRLPTHYDPDRLLIGVVGEIFCRLNTFSNDEIVRRLEEHGAEVWLSDIAEWLWYTHSEKLRRLRLHGRWFSLAALGAKIRGRVQKKDEHALARLFGEDFHGREEPESISTLLRYAEPYLPAAGALGEMVVSIGKAVYLTQKGVDGILDISPFTCMNGIVCEAIYPRVSLDLGNIPIRNFYFDGTQSDLDRDLGIFLELARSYRARKPLSRQTLVLPTHPHA
jgi:predicted nucleotide-binding protein (sugar kinase/HSP70/actin superfamily)